MIFDDDSTYLVALEKELHEKLCAIYKAWGESFSPLYDETKRGKVNPIDWISIQVQHPILKEPFYLVYGSRYEERGGLNSTKISQTYRIGDLYRSLEKRAKFYDSILFGDELYLAEDANMDYPFCFHIGHSDRVSLTIGRDENYWPKIDIFYKDNDLTFWDDIEKVGVDINQRLFDHAFLISGIDAQYKNELYNKYVALTKDEKSNPVCVLYDILKTNLNGDGDIFSNRVELFLGSIFFKWQHAYYDRLLIGNEKIIRGGITIASKVALRRNDYLALAWRIKNIAVDWLWRVSERNREKKAISAAIGSIMSRNGSHNIGSHVLAALSHNVGTMPDDRVLYQYIQHRMDYIATATTEFPTWRQPMLFVSSVMKQFMMQKHLLNFISRSEGLQAYQFQNPALTASTQPNTIRLHIRRIHDEIKDWEGRGKYSESEYDNFIPYGNEKAGSFERDILVAIPGGVIGQHAFYTIIENILRNAAKHEWATTKIKNDHLDVYIDFHDNPNEGVVEFQVWNDRVNKDKETSDDRNISSLVKTLAERMSASFIDNEGGLRKENWGLAEMRISAGFLRGSDVSLVGGIGVGQKEMLGLIRPLVVGNGEGKECLGYRFDLHKPRELLVVLPNKYCEGKGAKFTADKIISLNKMLSQYGVNVMSESEAGKSKGLAYSYVLFDNFDGKVQGRYNLPFRVLSAGDAINLSNEGRRVRVVAKFNGDFIKDVRNELECLPEHDQGDTIRTFAHKILEQIYSSWIVHVRSQRSDIGKDPALVIDIKDDGGGGKSLFANANLLYFIFESSFNSAVRSYLAMHTPESLTPSLAGALYAFTELSPRPQFSAKELAEEVDDDADVGNMILAQLVKWGDLAKEDMRVCKGYTTEGLDGMILPLQDEWNGAEIWQKEFAKWSPRVGTELLLNGLLGYDSDACAKMHDFINYLSGPILEQARAYLAKYEERYATLPEGFGIQNGADKNDDAKLKLGIDNSVQSISFTSDDVKKSKLKKQAFCYWRHGDKDVSDNNACNKINEKATYLEPLSGAQSYLNAFRELCSNLCYIKNGKGQVIRDAQLATKRNDAIRFVAELVENSVMRVLIIDERTKKFADEHPDVAAIFASTGISVLGGGEEVVAGIFRSFSANPKIANNKGFAKKIKGIPIRDFEILIVHQGIIDKQLHGSGKEAMIKVFYEWLKKYMRYVVITTGRGTPPNVPSDARVLPFSVIENTLFKRYPEKMLLVDTVMNMLPIGERGA